MEEILAVYSPLQLAYLGDAVFETFIRRWVIENHDFPMDEMNKRVVEFVNATSQAKAVKTIGETLTEQEWKIVKKGRNTKSASTSKSASISDYRYATGLEALIGALYLQGNMERLKEIVNKIIEVHYEEI